ncbi:MAG TPA: DUF2235 domain-containing protein [Mariniphaga sp.]|nr:DUF2235 domain-containing protein [Mariniphaga sp.]
MGMTFVYNSGEAVDPKDELHVSFGLFFDGTLNNKENTRIREAVDNGSAAKWEKEALKKYGGKGALDKIFGNEANTSYINDYTNVARKWSCCKQPYAIYVEGIGTLDKLGDEQEGFMLGSGKTGVRGKVRIGCEELVKRIVKEIGNDSKETKQLKTITIDTFGFSRGATAARNFVYEINGNRRAIDDETKPKKVQDGYTEVNTTPNYGNDYQSVKYVPKYKTIYLDRDKKEADAEYLENGKLPKFGYLGYLLLKNGVVSKEDLKSLVIKVRFIGVYDTVSSYEEVNDSTLKLFIKAGWSQIKNQFNNDVEQLQLNNLGSFQKAVHFTAMDEHRENFDLTRMIKMPTAIEKNFPGVHCDIGGAYLTGTEIVDEIETSNHKPLWMLRKRMKQLIEEYWYKEDQIAIKNWAGNILTGGLVYRKLKGKRFLHKEYSYIPLHFMETMFKEVLANDVNKVITQSMENKYPLKIKVFVKPENPEPKKENINKDDRYIHKPVYDKFDPSYYKPKIIEPLLLPQIIDDEILINAKDHLSKYVFEGEPEWKFLNDDEVRKRKEETIRKQMIADLLRIQEEESKPADNSAEEEIEESVLEEVVITSYNSQALLRKLRNQYLHWSATRDWMGMDPRNDYKRVEH